MIRNSKKNNPMKKISKRKKILVHELKIKKSRCDIKSVSYHDYLIESLRNPQEAASYLNAALEGGNVKMFLLALQNVVQAQGGITTLSEKIHKSRTSLYKSLSENGNPYLKSANDLLTAMGMHLAVIPNNSRF